MLLQQVIRNVLLTMMFLFCPSLHAGDMEVLISRLGSESYFEREDSAKQIRKAGYEAIAHLEHHFNDLDLEVALRSKELYEEYLHIKDGEMPSIWFLAPELRFPEGYGITFSSNNSLCCISCNKDVAADFYCAVKQPEMRTVADQCNELYFNLFDTFWRDPKACSKAMRMYVREELKKGKSKKQMELIIRNTKKNMVLCEPTYQTSKIGSSNVLDYWSLPPGVLVLKKDFVFPSR
jgi:hypothetical protein